MEPTAAFKLDIRPDKVALVTIDVTGEKINTLKASFVPEVNHLILELKKTPDIQGLVFISGKPDSFIAGADIHMIDNCTRAQEGEALSRKGQQVMAEIAALPFPVVAAIHGACLGGGLELALACHRRVCSDDQKTRLGLPEVQLGLLPGSGGTQRLPRLIGVSHALDMMLTGRQLRARQALKLGLVDEVVPHTILLEAAIAQINKGRGSVRKLTFNQRLLALPPARFLLFQIVGKKIQQKSQGHYPATERIIDVVNTGLIEGETRGYQAEARAFGELVMTPASAALRGLFFASTALKKEPGAEATAKPIHSLGVLGGGLMGGGIAFVSATKGHLPVRIKDINAEGINHALKYCWDLLSEKVRRHSMTPALRKREMSRISGAIDYRGFKHRDVVIEAVFEDLALKQKMVAEIEQCCAPETIFASNTSSLPIADIAAQAARPEQVIGMHFFSPVEKMPLVEVIPHARTSQQTIATTVALAKKQGKTVIVVNDCPGFYVNRILAPYINEALHCLMEGEPIDKIDQALVAFGFPIGPLQLLDEIGIDVAMKIIPVLQQAYGERFACPQAVSAILSDGRKGRKNGRGFYLYSTKRRKSKREVDMTLYPLLNITPEAKMGSQAIAQRCVMMMLNEAVRCLDESVLRGVRDGDVGAVFGIGFPAFLGGPFHYMDNTGIAVVAATLTQLAAQYGDRFAPCDALLRFAQQQTRFSTFQASV